MSIASPSFPFIVLTLRRTGGTSLVSFMSGISDFKTVQHEPFNVDRVWGGIVSKYKESSNLDGLNSDISDVLHNRPNIKHCFEIIPLHVTLALIEQCVKRGYKFFILTRKNEVDRIISLEIARATNVWGPSEARTQYPKITSGQIIIPPVDVDEAIRGYRRDASVLGQVLRIIRHRNIPISWIIYEEIYSGIIASSDHAINIASQLGKEIFPGDDRLSVFKGEAKQNSGSITKHVPKIDELRRLLEAIDVF